ncbi:MAG: response regulator [Treponemataceae bacterium]|nr:response regulator [Treponemataceae bacterium]
MQIDKLNFIQDYILESYEYLDSLDDICIQLTKDSSNENLLKELLRLLHSFKGSSRLLEFTQIEKIIHNLETVFKNIQNEQDEVDLKTIQLLLNCCQAIRKTVEEIQDKNGEEGSQNIKNFDFIIENIQKAAEKEDYSVDFGARNIFEEIDATQDSSAEMSEDESQSLFRDQQTIKIPVSKINTILQSFDKLIMRQIGLKKQIENLKGVFQDNDLHISHELDENLAVIEQQSFNIQEKIISLRMLPFDTILQPIKRSIVSEALKLEKNIDIDIPHSEISIDKSILENLPKILIHIVRNAIDHGIETSEERIKAGKEAQGRVSIRVAQVSNRIFITVSDDGRGINFGKIREKAIKKYPDREKEIEAMEKNELLQFIFISGFSTRDTQSELSGRGIGMDVVRTEMDKLKGKIHIDSAEGIGTSIELSLPSSLATQDGLFIQVGGSKYLILSHYIKEIITVSKDSFMNLQNGPVINLHNELIPVYDFDSITGKVTESSYSKKMEVPIVVIEYLNRKIAIITDEILNYTTVVIKALPPILKNFKALQGVVFDENYSIIPVLNIPDSIQRFKGINIYDIKNLEVRKQRKVYNVLIADDSATTRHIEQLILESEDYKVTTACDGIEALEKLKEQHYDLLVTDIQMPRMDGFILVQNMRRIDSLKDIPVIIVSSVFEQDTLQIVKELNAEYIVKSDFERENLISKAKELLHDQ